MNSASGRKVNFAVRGKPTYLMGRFSAVFGLMEPSGKASDKTITLVTNVQCSEFQDYPDLPELVTYFSPTKNVLASTKSTLNIAWITVK